MNRRRSLRLGLGAVAGLAVSAPLRAVMAPLPARAASPVVDPPRPPDVLPRDTWAVDRPPLAEPRAEDVRFLLVHHTAGETDHSEQGAIEQMQMAYDFHTGPDKGWPDVAYNYFIDRFGRVFEGRAGSLAGPVVADATGGSQGYAQLVCLLGDFTSVMPSEEALSALRRTLAWLADRYEIDTAPGATVEIVSRGSNLWPAGTTVRAATISGHRDMSNTACPGDTFYPYVHDGLAAAVDALRRQPTWPSGIPPTTSVPVATAPPPSADPTTSPPPPSSAEPTVAGSAPTTVGLPPLSTIPTTSASVPLATLADAASAGTPTGEGNRVWPVIGGLAVAGTIAAATVATRRRGGSDASEFDDD